MARFDPGPPSVELPDPAAAEPGAEILALGSAIDPSLMLAGYRRGLFAMPWADDLIGWFSPDPRGVLPLENLHVSRSLRRSMRRYRVSVDEHFPDVVAACADRARPGHWITAEFELCYRQLHHMGWAHSIEVWDGPQLVGGLFGVEVGGLFAGESMFHAATDASKTAMVALVQILAAAGGQRLLDVQWWSPHLGTMGVVEVGRPEYLRQLAAVAAVPAAFDSAAPGD